VSPRRTPTARPAQSHAFIEPSSAQLWQAAGLDPEKLQTILEQYDRDLDAWKKKNFRRKIRTHELSPSSLPKRPPSYFASLPYKLLQRPGLLRMFDQLTASQQMALSQLVFQMGVNLEEFTQFLSVVNDLSYRDSAQLRNNAGWELEHWKMCKVP